MFPELESCIISFNIIDTKLTLIEGHFFNFYNFFDKNRKNFEILKPDPAFFKFRILLKTNLDIFTRQNVLKKKNMYIIFKFISNPGTEIRQGEFNLEIKKLTPSLSLNLDPRLEIN